MKYSVIVPVYNRPDEVDELLKSLTLQSYTDFDIVIVEDGSAISCKDVVEQYTKRLNISYFYKTNSGPGHSRNFGMQKATGEYFIIFDSDCIVPPEYFEKVDEALANDYLDSFGGPDDAHPSFNVLQKAINYSMTSFFTTGGIRGGGEKMDAFFPRSFNMGISRKVFEQTKGFSAMRFGEDIDLSIRMKNEGFRIGLIKKAFVYHCRRSTYRQFFKQIFNSGIARIILWKKHPGSLKLVHMFPVLYVLGFVTFGLLSIFCSPYFIFPIILQFLIIFIDSSIRNGVAVGCSSIPTSFIQLTAYGLGFISGFWNGVILRKEEFSAFKDNFYK